MTDARTDPWGDLDLHEVLDRATDAIEPPGLAAAALTEAHRRRLRTRGVASGLAAVAAVAALVVSLQAIGGDPRTQERPAEPASSGAVDVRVAPAIPPSRVQPVWDPRGAEELPVLELGVPRVLPVAATGPVTRAVALLDAPAGALVVGTDGAQAALDLPEGLGDGRTVALSPDGRRVAAVGLSGLFWRDLDGGSWQRVEAPESVVGGDIGATWLPDSDAVVLTGWRPGVRVDLDSGEVTALAELTNDVSWAVDADGDLTVVAMSPQGPALRELDGESVERRSLLGPLENLQRPALSSTSILAARADVNGATGPRPADERDGLIALDRDTLATRAFLPLPDDTGYYVDGGTLAPLAWLDERTALFTVLPQGAPKEYLVAWDVSTGDLSRVACWPHEYAASFATDLLGA